MKLFKLFARLFFSRLALTIISFIIQIIIIYLLFSVGRHVVWIFGGFTLIGIIIVLFIVNSKRNPSYKIAWIIPLLLFPGFGVLLYTMYKLQFSIRNMRKRLIEEKEISKKYLKHDELMLENIKKADKNFYNLVNYVDKVSNYKVHGVNEIVYFNIHC